MRDSYVSILYPRHAAQPTATSEGPLKSVLMKSQIRWRHPVAVTPASPAFQASFNEQIKHIIRKLHAVFVQPQQQQDKSLCGMIERHMIFARPIDHFPDFDRLVVRSRHDLGPVRGKRHRHDGERDRIDVPAVGVDLLAQQLQLVCQTSQQVSVSAKKGLFECSGAPESQTLIVLSSDPDTILVPSGENATDLT